MHKDDSCCLIGYGPDKLKWDCDEKQPDCLALKAKLAKAVEEKYARGVRVFYTGMARGADIWAAEIVLKMRREQPGSELQLIGVLPYDAQAARWPDDWRRRHDSILDACDGKVILQGAYTPGCIQARNRYLVDCCAHMIAVGAGSNRGTQSAVDYARKNHLDIVLIDPDAPESTRSIKPLLTSAR